MKSNKNLGQRKEGDIARASFVPNLAEGVGFEPTIELPL